MSDFTGFSANITTATTETAFTSDTVTLAPGAQTGQLIVQDDDPNFQDAFIETDAFSVLAEAASIPLAAGGTLDFPSGTRLENEFTLTTNDTPPIQFFIVRLGGAISNSGTNQLILTSAPLTPGQSYTFASGSDGPSTPYDIIICFSRGVRIETPDGQRAVETLEAGDVVRTASGEKAIRWIGNRRFGPEDLAEAPHLKPVRIDRGALGPDQPAEPVMLSPQHRVALGGSEVSLMFGCDIALAPAGSLVGRPGIGVATDVEAVEYRHILLDDHETVFAEGLAVETLLPGRQALRAVDAAARREISEILGDAPYEAAPKGALLKDYEARALSTLITPS